MPTGKSRRPRPLGTRRYRKRFLLATEGTKTEPEYFNVLGRAQPSIHLKCRGSGGAPHEVLELLQREIAAHGLDDVDEAWLVVDKDHWTDEQLSELHVWAQGKPNYGLALSNPSFEYWLLLHFEVGAKIGSAKDCDRRLQQHLPHYRRAIKPADFTDAQIRQAVKRAKARDTPPCADWPRDIGKTTVYRLVEKILNA